MKNLKILYECFNQNGSLLSCSTKLNSVQFNKCFMRTYYVSDTMQGTWDTEWIWPCPQATHHPMGKTDTCTGKHTEWGSCNNRHILS